MPREAKLFSSSSGSAVRGFLKFRANIPPRWIKNARTSRKRVEPEIVRDLRTLKQVHQTHVPWTTKCLPRGKICMLVITSGLFAQTSSVRAQHSSNQPRNFYISPCEQ